MKAFITSLFILFAVILFAQTPAPSQGFDPEQNLRALANLTPLSAGAVGFDNRYGGVHGSPLLFTEFQMGMIQFTKQDTFSTAFNLNLDLIKNSLLVRLRNGTWGEISATNIKALQFQNAPNQPAHWIVASEKEVEGVNSVRMKFYGTLHEGQYRLLKSVEKTFKKADYQGAYNNGSTYDEFLTAESYWLSTPGKPFEKVKIKRKDMEKALSDRANQVEKILKDNKLNLNNEQDVVQLLILLEK